jgi:hypothetical protein
VFVEGVEAMTDEVDDMYWKSPNAGSNNELLRNQTQEKLLTRSL